MSAASREGHASPALASSHGTPSRPNASGSLGKPRSCAICASRKVRCDKQYPCGRCRRAGIACVLPAIDHRPQWARHLISRSNNDARALSVQSTSAGMAVGNVLDRLKLLEGLVKDLSHELEQAQAKSTTVASQSGSQSSEASWTHVVDTSATTPQAGRIILDDSDRVRYVTSGFWSRIDHELDSLKEDTRAYESEETEAIFAGDQSQSRSPTSSTAEADRTPLDRHAFLLKHNLSPTSPDTSMLFPMASQIPFLLEVFSERVHFIVGIPHMPSLKKLLQRHRVGRMQGFSPSEEALVFSCFYAAICSMDDEEVTTSFTVSKNELALKYRVGLENALSKADFLNNPSDVLVQAFIIFLALARRHDSPKFVWMMTGLVIRMAHYLGFHRDGSESNYITPFQVEVHRRIWWNLCALDMRVTEDQGTELAIPYGSYSTRNPSNINDADIWPEMEHSPVERRGLTNVTLLRLCHETARLMQDMMASGVVETIDDHNRLVNEMKQKFDREFFSLADASEHPAYLAAAGTMRVILSRLTLLAFPPVLYSAPEEKFSTEIRTKLLVAAIDVAEHNHALNTDARCQPWRWVYQTQQHWHAVVFLLIEICWRPWSPTIERAWVALQSPWLVPTRAPTDKNFSVWAPIRKLMARARKHRENEIVRLQNDPDAAAEIERHDQQRVPIPSSSDTFPTYFDPGMFYKRWHQLIRPAAASTTSTLDNDGSATSNKHNIITSNRHFGSSDDANNMHGMMPSMQDNPPAFAATTSGGAASPIAEPWAAAAMDFTDYSNLDSFLGTDTEMDFIDVMNTDNALNFDWNSWFESVKGVL